jgi:hypothetical protein
MEFLLSTPVPIRAVFVAKLLQAVLPNFSLILLFGLPVLFGLGASRVIRFCITACADRDGVLALAAAGLSSLLVMLVVRVFPAAAWPGDRPGSWGRILPMFAIRPVRKLGRCLQAAGS